MNRFFRQMAAIVTAAFFCTLITHNHSAFAAEQPETYRVILTVRSGQNAAFITELDIQSSEITRALNSAKQETISDPSYMPDIDVSLLQNNKRIHFHLEPTGNLWNESTSQRLVLTKKASDKLLQLADSLRAHHYGKMIPWESAAHMVPKKSIFSVTDLGTGLTFLVQRRAGKDHADVQPVTKEDTRIMKQIYHDGWSWKRKAVLVHSGDEWIAASMNGMPHGGDGIPGNGFSGHFCIHFYLSSTHKSELPDLTHQIMVHKAAGNLRPFFDSASPLILAKSFVEVMNHQDQELLQQVAEGLSKEKFAYFAQEMESLGSIREKKQSRTSGADDEAFEDSLSAEIRLPITIHKQSHAERHTDYRFIFKRESKQSPWRIQDILTDKDKMDPKAL
ncbi:hypothetical protein [Paenibacillus prosopidis]|uniref:Uncharacterized protein n=1 Tax=Paenibacillus prosopidis TaxID=630520 RepID=A0A368W1E9_9BACL|nr:hypothetical protein [Paenibacillus prosopidis]RCW48845.1 hypothetical protein DFP97_10528 [Paenibacillus prosopidis]